jgi:hypothetical protein
MKKFVDQKRSGRQFMVGDMVYLKLQPYRQHAFDLPQHLNLMTKYYGPFKILSKTGPAAYKLQLPTTTEIHLVFHVSQLKSTLDQKLSLKVIFLWSHLKAISSWTQWLSLIPGLCREGKR